MILLKDLKALRDAVSRLGDGLDALIAQQEQDPETDQAVVLSELVAGGLGALIQAGALGHLDESDVAERTLVWLAELEPLAQKETDQMATTRRAIEALAVGTELQEDILKLLTQMNHLGVAPPTRVWVDETKLVTLCWDNVQAGCAGTPMVNRTLQLHRSKDSFRWHNVAVADPSDPVLRRQEWWCRFGLLSKCSYTDRFNPLRNI